MIFKGCDIKSGLNGTWKISYCILTILSLVSVTIYDDTGHSEQSALTC